MLKKLICILFLCTILPVCAGLYDEAIKKNDKVFLYLYSAKCGYCMRFNPIYQRISKMYDTRFQFVKLDVTTPEGTKLARQFAIRYVPFVVIIDKGNAMEIPSKCLLEFSCMDSTVSKF